MSYASIEEKLSQIDRRLRSLEERVGLHPSSQKTGSLFDGLTKMNHREWSRVLGWFLLTVSGLTMFTAWVNGDPYNLAAAFGIVLGGWLLIRSTHLIGLSGSARELLREERGRQARGSHALHHGAGTRLTRPVSESERMFALLQFGALVLGVLVFSVSYSWLIYTYVADPAWQVVGWLIVPMAFLTYASARCWDWLSYAAIALAYLLLVGNRAPLFSLLATVAFTVLLLMQAWPRRNWLLHGLAMVASYGVIGYWTWAASNYSYWTSLIPSGGWTTIEQILAATLVFFSLVFAWPFAYERRQIADRQLAAGILCLNAAGFIGLGVWLGSFFSLLDWAVLQAMLVVVSLGLGYLSWLRHHRFSYAKYYFLIALAGAAVLAVSYFDVLTIGLGLFVASVVLLSLGFIGDSYTSRTAGLGTLAAAVLYYFGVVLVDLELGRGFMVSYEPVWMGVILSVFLVVVAGWFGELKAIGAERQVKPYVIVAAYCAAFFTLFSLAFYVLPVPQQSVAWLLLGLVGTAIGRRHGLPSMRALGIGLFLIATVKLFLVDSLALNAAGRWSVFTAFGVLLISGGYLASKYRRFIISLFV